MRNKLLVSTALLAAAVAAASCEKTPNEEPAATQRGPAASEGQHDTAADQHQTGADAQGKQAEPTDAQQRSSQTAIQSQSGPNEQQSKGGRQDQSSSSEGQPVEQDRQNQPEQNQAQLQQNQPGQGQPIQDRQNQPEQSQALPQVQQNQPGQNQRTSGSANLTPEQRTRQAQMVLKEKGFDVGKVDGVLGPRTRNALIAFQRQQGLEASGQFDQQTAAALGISDGAGSTSSGQSGARRQ